MTALDADRVEPVTDELPVLGVPDAGWQRLDPRMLAVRPVLDLARLLPVVLFLLITGGTNDDQWRIVLGGLAALAVLVAGVLRWSTTTYRITGERVELRTGLLRRHHRSVHRDRIRTADLTSTLVHRAVGLAVVRIGTGTHAGSGDAELHLDAVGHAEAERLRALLLREPGDAHDSPVVARLDPAWVRFAPLTFSTVIVVGAIWAAFLRLAEELGWSPEEAGRLGLASGPVTLGLLGLGLLALAAVGSSVIFVEGWWGYRLTRADDGGLVVRRGLLTHRSLTLEGRRIRGVELTEPLLLRLGRGARALALTSGLHAHHGERPRGEHVGALAPALPRAEAHRIAAATLGVGPEAGDGGPADPAPARSTHPPLRPRRRPLPGPGRGRRRRPRAVARAGDRRRGAAGRRARARGGPLGGARPRADPDPPRRPQRGVDAAHGRAAPRRGDRLAGPPVGLPAPGGAGDAGRRLRGRARALRGARRRRRPGDRAGRGDDAGPADAVRRRPHSTVRRARDPLSRLGSRP